MNFQNFLNFAPTLEKRGYTIVMEMQSLSGQHVPTLGEEGDRTPLQQFLLC